ncbi:unnamed protein product [Lactuca virosa]|uniref:Uncharacterized protein n=1 Tax=Lactuca virosa TaxID=75947 RepID=A0AAU9M6A2_9ASTR|nr:unnamed protein product [Lactuca virosa]
MTKSTRECCTRIRVQHSRVNLVIDTYMHLISNSLNTTTFKNFRAYDLQVSWLKCVFKYASVLERLDIRLSKLGDMNRITKGMNELENFEKEATACVIKFL